MKIRDRIFLSVLAGMVALSLYTSPMWWGVLFSPVARSMSVSPAEEAVDTSDRFQWESGDVVFRLKALDLLQVLLRD